METDCPLLLLPPQWGEGSVTFLLVQKSDAKRHAREGDCDFPRLTNLKTRACVLINFSYKSVNYLYFLGSCTIGIFCCFVYDYFSMSVLCISAVSSVGAEYCLIRAIHFSASAVVCFSVASSDLSLSIFSTSSCCSACYFCDNILKLYSVIRPLDQSS